MDRASGKDIFCVLEVSMSEWPDLGTKCELLQYLGVDPCIGFSMARFIMAAVTRVKSNQSPINRHHKFFSESNRGIDHIPISVQN